MNSQLYNAASGLINEQRRLELISNNLANVSTSGYRAQRQFSTIYQEFQANAPSTLQAANAGVAPAGAYEVPGPAPTRATGRELDVALPNGSFLTVETAAGRRYTRAGNLQISRDGSLTDAGGRTVLDAAGKPIKGLVPGARISRDGRVLVDGAETGRITLVGDPAGVLKREGASLLTAGGRDAELEKIAEPDLQPGWLEGSGTDALIELVNLIEAQRGFESYQKLISLTMNEVNRRAVNDLAG